MMFFVICCLFSKLTCVSVNQVVSLPVPVVLGSMAIIIVMKVSLLAG